MSLIIFKASLLPVSSCFNYLAEGLTNFNLYQYIYCPRFSNNAKFVYSRYESSEKWLYPTDISLQKSLKQRVLNHPYSLDEDRTYVSYEDIYGFVESDGSDLLLFQHRKVCDPPDAYRRRILCILPDVHQTKTFKTSFTLIWPPADAEDSEVKVLARPMQVKLTGIIRTGIQSADLLSGDEWQQMSLDNERFPFPSMYV